MDRDVHRVEAGGDVVARPGEDHVPGEIRRGDPFSEVGGVLDAAAMHAADDEAAELGEAPARACDRLDHEMLPLPVLDVADDPGESKNLRHEHPEILDDLRTRLEKWSKEVLLH